MSDIELLMPVWLLLFLPELQLMTGTGVTATFLLLQHIGGCSYNTFSGELADVTAVVWLSAVVDSNSCAAQCRLLILSLLPVPPPPPPLPSFLNNSFSHLGKKYSNNVTTRN